MGERDRWRLTYDNEHQEDEYDERPSEFEVRQARRAASDAWTRVYRLVGGWRSVLVEEYPPLDGSRG